MTDGAAALQEEAIEELLQEHGQAAKTTVLTLGIGFGVHRGLVDMMAATTGVNFSAPCLSRLVPSTVFFHTCSSEISVFGYKFHTDD